MPSLDALLESGAEVAAVVTNPDRPAGRGMELRASPVKRVALDKGFEVYQPPSARAPEVADWLAARAPHVAVVVAYGKILPGELLTIPERGFVNVHFSLLPVHRGAAPVQRSVMAGESETGVSIMVLTEGMDEGPVLAVGRTAIGDDETAGEVGDRLAVMGAELLAAALPRYVAGEVEPAPQDPALATYAPKVTPEEARVDWRRPARRVHDLVRGLNPAPGAWTDLRGARVKLWRTSLAEGAPELAPGALAATDDDLLVGTGDRPLSLIEVQASGRKRMSGAELARGLRLEAGERFG